MKKKVIKSIANGAISITHALQLELFSLSTDISIVLFSLNGKFEYRNKLISDSDKDLLLRACKILSVNVIVWNEIKTY